VLDRETDQAWVSAHVFTGHPLDLVVCGLLPAVLDDLRPRGLADRFFFIRHWQFGPHLRLRVRATAPDAEPRIRAALDAHTTAFFADLPSTPAMTEHQYAELAARFGPMEPGTQAGTLASNDSLAFIRYQPENTKYGHGAALRAAEECFATCSELALAAATAQWTPAQRLAHCFALLAATPGPSGGSPAIPLSGTAVEQYRRSRATLLPVARSARAALAEEPPGGPGDDPAARWFASFRRARDLAADPALLHGQLTHLACNRLGVRLEQEATLRQLAALAVHELTGGPEAEVGLQ